MPMSVQITETFEISYFDKDHQFIKLRRDNAPLSAAQDTGIKMTALLIVNKDDKPDKEYGKIMIRTFKEPFVYGQPANVIQTDVPLKNNRLILLKARNVEYEIRANT